VQDVRLNLPKGFIFRSAQAARTLVMRLSVPDAQLRPLREERLLRALEFQGREHGASRRPVAIVTGGASGIAAHVLRLGAEGARVVVVDINDEAGAAVSPRPGARGRRAYEHCDVGEPAEVAALVERTVGRFGRLDILHNNAVQTGAATWWSSSPRLWQRASVSH